MKRFNLVSDGYYNDLDEDENGEYALFDEANVEIRADERKKLLTELAPLIELACRDLCDATPLELCKEQRLAREKLRAIIEQEKRS